MRNGTFRPVYGTAIRLLSSHRWRHCVEARELVAALYATPPAQVWRDAPLCDGCEGCDPRQRVIPFV